MEMLAAGRLAIKKQSAFSTALFFGFALFPLRGDNEINFLRKKLRGLGYSVLRKQNTAIPQLWRSPAKDLIAHSPKKGKEQSNISPKNSLTHPAADTHAPASHRSGSYPVPGAGAA